MTASAAGDALPPSTRTSIARVFLSYRRWDTPADARLLQQAIEARFPGVSVFLDVRDVELGAEFKAVIRKELEVCDAVLALIGPNWLGGGRHGGVGDERDVVRFELGLALEEAALRRLPVVPVLVRGADPPSEDQLPAPLAALAGLNAQEISHDRYHADVARLLGALERLAGLGHGEPPGSPADPLPPVPTPRPAAPALCVGRDRLVADLVAGMLAVPPMPVPVLGGPGIGKTTACLAAFHDPRVVARFGERRWFVRCDGADGPEGLANALSASTGATGGAGTNWHRSLAALRGGPGLLVLDNLESPWEADQSAVEELLTALTALPQVVLVVTMRGAVRPYGLRWRDVEPVSALPATAARELFLSVAGRKFEDDERLDGLLGVLGGVPLALGLLGHVAQSEPHLGQLVERWGSERLSLLQRGRGDRPDLSVAISIEVSLASPRLVADGSRLLSVLARLPDGMAHPDLSALFPRFGLRGGGNLRQLGLVFDEADRLRCLAPVREHVAATHRPDQSDIEGTIFFYARLAAESGPRIGGAQGALAFRRIAADANNIAEVLQTTRLDDVDLLTDAVEGLLEYLRFAGARSPELLAHVAAEIEGRGSAVQRARVAALQGRVELACSAYDAARRHFERALTAYTAEDHAQGEADCLRGLGHIARDRGAYGEASECYERSAQSSRRAGDVLGAAHCRLGVGDVALARGDQESSEVSYRAAQDLFRRRGDRLGEAHAEHGLGQHALRRGDVDDARRRFDRAHEIYASTGALIGQAHCTLGHGHLALLGRDLEGARDRYERAFVEYQQVGHVLGEAHSLHSLGVVAERGGDRGVAESRYEQAMDRYASTGVWAGRARTLHALGHLAGCGGQRRRAEEHFHEALLLFERVGDALSAQQCREDLADGGPERPGRDVLRHERLPEPWATGMAAGGRNSDPEGHDG